MVDDQVWVYCGRVLWLSPIRGVQWPLSEGRQGDRRGRRRLWVVVRGQGLGWSSEDTSPVNLPAGR